MSLKLQKEIERDIHEQLYMNVFSLTLNYPTTDDFNACFKRDMFVKNNKTAYLHVVHFLINVLDPVFFKQRSIWPILEVKMEVPFRNEIMKYINELNTHNKETGIPLLMTSHLISPGGYKFVEFVFRLSQYVLCEHVKRITKTDLIPFPPKANKDYSISSEQVKNMETIVDDNYNELVESKIIFNTKMNTLKEKIVQINEKILELEFDIKNNENSSSNECEISDVVKTLSKRKQKFEEYLKKLETDSLAFQKCSTLTGIFSESKNALNGTVISNAHNSNNSLKNYIDLIEHFQTLLDLLKNNKYFIKSRKDPNLTEYTKMAIEVISELNVYNEKYTELLSELELYISDLENYKPTIVDEELYKYNKLSERIHNLFQEIPPISFCNL